MKFKLAVALLALVPLIFVGQACNRVSYGADDKSKIHVGIVFDIGGKDDRSFNAAAWAGVKCAETGMLPDGKTSCGKPAIDRKSTRLNSSHLVISYAVFCLKKKKKTLKIIVMRSM